MNDYERNILELWNQNYSTALIAEKLKVTKNMICGQVNRMRKRGINIAPRAMVIKIQTGANDKIIRKPKSTIDAPLIDLIFKRQAEEKIKPVVVIKEPPIAKPKNIRFKNLTSKSCRYVINDGRPENFIFCGAPKERGSYCEAHALICYVPSKPAGQRRRNPNEQQRCYK